MSEKLDKAISFAVDAHKGQKRKMEKTPYILHPMEVAAIVGSITDDEEIMMAALLHDVVEDTETTLSDIEEEFGPRVAKLVASETEDKRRHKPPIETWKTRKEESLEELKTTRDEGIKILWLADKLSNMRALYRGYRKNGDRIFETFNQKNKEEHAWYYRTIARYLEKYQDLVAYEEYIELINKVFL